MWVYINFQLEVFAKMRVAEGNVNKALPFSFENTKM